jgi:N-acetylglucosaminyldiphosphoundecaprenol N-acetyl-beta-D-mannosaminyltransferase
MNLLGVRIDNFSKKEILEKVESFLRERKFHQIATINPEFILEAQKNPEFRNILNDADLNIADGIGIRFAFWRLAEKLKCRMAGADLMHEILRIANEKKLAVFLAVNEKGLSLYEETQSVFSKLYPNVVFNGANLDIQCHSGLDPESQKILKQVKDDKGDIKILLVNFGAPFQEKFINSLKNDTIMLAMGVGGSFDYATGKLQRAPKIMRILGLEWLWRLFLQPKRWKRIWNAVIVFPIKILFLKN